MLINASIEVGDIVNWAASIHPDLDYVAVLDGTVIEIEGTGAVILVRKNRTISAELIPITVPLKRLKNKRKIPDEKRNHEIAKNRLSKAKMVDESLCRYLMEEDGDRYHESIEEYLDYCEGIDQPPNAYLWAATLNPVGEVCTDTFVEDLTEQIGEEWTSDLRGLDRLQKAIDIFYKDNALFTIETDYSKFVLVCLKGTC